MLAALRLARERGGAGAALRESGVDLPQPDRFAGLREELGAVAGSVLDGEPTREALALGFLAGRLAIGRRARMTVDPTSFVMDRELVVQGAEGESVLRLPWFADGLFVGRQLPDISEMPAPIREQCVTHYTAAFDGERSCFSFVSYGHVYRVDAVPVHDEDGGVENVLAIATPAPPHAAAVTAYEQAAARLEAAADAAQRRAELHRRAGRDDPEWAERQVAARARKAARRAAAHARRLHSRPASHAAGRPPVTPREVEVLQLASHGMTACEIAELLGVSAVTVRAHLRHIYRKLDVPDKTAAVAAALRHRLID